MTLRLDHLFICTAVGGPEATHLLELGFREGSRNIHPGQGTANRRFFFRHGFLELLWVHDENEARSTLTAPTRLWDRWTQRDQGVCPFGLCFSAPEGLDASLPFATWEYYPQYLPEDRCILFAKDVPLSEPEIFLLDWPQPDALRSEPLDQPLGLEAMDSVSVGLPHPASDVLRSICDAGLLQVHRSDSPELVITFRAAQPMQLDVPGLAIKFIA